MLSFSSNAHLFTAALVPQYVLIFLHGLGDVGMSWMSFFLGNKLLFRNTLLVFPNAPHIPITMNNHMVMPGWYDITTLNDTPSSHPSAAAAAEEIDDRVGFDRSSKQLLELLQHLQKKYNIQTNKVILGGMSCLTWTSD